MGDYTTFLERQRERISALRHALESDFAAGDPVILEFGCGHGHWLTSYAEADPTRACLGIDLISDRVRKANAKRTKRRLGKLHFYKAEAGEILQAWPVDRPIAAIFMLFPDPWPKARHHKHRMIQHAFLTEIATRVPAGTRFHFRTDHEDYFAWAMEHFAEHPGWQLIPDAPWPWETPTVFQKLMDSWQSLIAERTDAPLPHPGDQGHLDGQTNENQ
jgi:tRNA (guanine-N7-)-methyltransferase